MTGSEKRNAKEQDRAIETVVERLKETDCNLLPASKLFLNLVLYFLIANRNFTALKLNTLTDPDKWSRGLSLRTMALIIHELDLGKVTGKEFRDSLQELGFTEEQRKEAQNAIKALGKAQKKAEKKFSELRNNVMGHRDKDALKQYTLIAEMSPKESLDLMVEFYDASHNFTTVLTNLIKHSFSTTGMIRQLSKGMKK